MADLFGTEIPDDLRGTAGDDSLMGCAPGAIVPSTDPSPPTDNDTLDGRAGNDTLQGLNGDDLLFGGLGDDVLYGGLGTDVLFGGPGNDWFDGPGSGDQTFGGEGDDHFSGSFGTDGAGTVLDGGSGIDTLDLYFGWYDPPRFFSIPDPGGWSTLPDGTRLIGIESLDIFVDNDDCTLMGGAFDDTFQVRGDDPVLFGGGGNDRLLSHGIGGSTIFGGDGDDQVWVNSWDKATGVFFVDGGSGIDRISIYLPGATEGWHLSLQPGGTLVLPDQIILTGFEQFDLYASNFADNIVGGDYADGLNGMDGDDVLRGRGGDDRLQGDRGENTLTGGTGSDTLDGCYGAGQLFGGPGGDRLILQGGDDRATGGQGADLFQFIETPTPGTAATIMDFSGRDTILLDRYAFAALPFLRLSAHEFVLGTTAQDAGDRILYDCATGSLWYDPDGTGSLSAGLLAHLAPDTALTAADFLIL